MLRMNVFLFTLVSSSIIGKKDLFLGNPVSFWKTKDKNSFKGVSVGKLETVTVSQLECGPLSSSDSEDGGSELDTDNQSRASLGEEEEYNQQSIMSDLDSLTEPSIETAPVAATAAAKSESSGESSSSASNSNNSQIKLEPVSVSLDTPEVPCQERSINTALEDELMLLRLLDLHGAGAGRNDTRASYGAASLDSNINQVVQGAAAAPVTSSRPNSARNPIITADSIINTLQMEMATVGLTAAAINTATSDIPNRSRVCVSDQSPPPNATCSTSTWR